MEYTPPNQPPQNASGERNGFFDRWRKKEKARQSDGPEQQTPRPEAPKNPEDPPKEKTRREKFAENLGSFLFGDTAKKAGAESTGEPRAGREQHASPESDPLIDRATRVRRFARHVINHVFGTARAESEHGREWDGQEPLNTEPLFDAAEDLEDAVHDLDDAAEAHGGYSGGGDGSARSNRGERPEPDGSFSAHMAERMARRIEYLESRALVDAERHEARTAALKAGLGIVAVAGVLLIGHEYMVHKKIRKDQKELRVVQAQQQAENIMQKQRIDEMTRRERAAHYERLSQITHKEADVTREVAGDLQEENRMLQIIRTPQSGASQNNETHQAARGERVAARPEDLTAPVATVETADNVERGSMSPFSNGGAQHVGGTAANGGRAADVTSTQPASLNVPLSPAAQRALAIRQARAQRLKANAWIYGLALGGGLLIAGLAIVLIG